MSKKSIISKKRKQNRLPDENSNTIISRKGHSSALEEETPPSLQGETNATQEAERIETHILTFLKYQHIRKKTVSDTSSKEKENSPPKKKTKSSNPFTAAFSLSFLFENDGQSSQEEENPIWISVVQLQTFLTFEQDTTVSNPPSSSIISKAHVASLLLPWSLSNLLRINSEKNEEKLLLIWKTLATCLQVLFLDPSFGTEAEENILLQGWIETKGQNQIKIETHLNLDKVLTQATCLKLLTLAMQVGFKNDIGEVSRLAGKCYVLLVLSKLFRPTVDVVSRKLVDPLNDMLQMKDIANPGMDIYVNSHQFDIIHATLALFSKLQSKGMANPKKLFGLLSSESLLSCLARLLHVKAIDLDRTTCEMGEKEKKGIDDALLQLGKEILWLGLFHPQHHMDGFRTMELQVPEMNSDIGSSQKKDANSESKRKKIYQDNLFVSLKSLIETEKTNRKADDLYVIRLMPMLVEGFMHQMDEWNKDLKKDRNVSKKALSRADSVAKIQFRFCSCIIQPIIERINQQSCNQGNDNKISVYMLHSMKELLDLILRHSAYLPSYKDDGDVHISFLKSIGEHLLGCDDKHEGGERLCVFEILFNLNHHVFHDKLPRVISEVSLVSNIGISGERASNLMCTISQTYQQLRQLTHLINALLVSASSCHDNFTGKDGTQISRVSKLTLSDRAFVTSISQAIQFSPSGQTKELWLFLNDYIGTIVREKTGDQKHLIQFVTELFIVIIKAIKINNYNAKEIQECCEQSTKSCVSYLLGRHDETLIKEIQNQPFDQNSPVLNIGLHLYGWLVDVHSKCCFWLNEMPHERKDDIDEMRNVFSSCSSIIPSLLCSIKVMLERQDTQNTTNAVSLIGSLQHLSCHRLQQLHSSIYQQQQFEALNKENDQRSNQMIEEAKLLSTFLVFAAEHRVCKASNQIGNLEDDDHSYAGAGWKVITKNLLSWAPYTTSSQIQSFLKWVFLVIATEESSKCIAEQKSNLPDKIFQDERACALGLLNDASFFEIDQICGNYVSVGLSCIAELIQLALPISIIENEKFKLGKAYIITGPSHSAWSMLSSFDLKNLMKDCLQTTIEVKEMVRSEYISQSLVVLKYLIEMCHQSISTKDTLILLDMLFRIHIIVHATICHSQKLTEENHSKLMEIIYICRSSMAEIFALPCEQYKFVTDAIPDIVTYILRSSKDLSDSHKGNEGGLHPLTAYITGGQVLSGLFSLCSRPLHNDTAPFIAFTSSMESIIKSETKDIILTNMMRPTILKMIHQDDPPNGFRIKDKKTGKMVRESISAFSISLKMRLFGVLKQCQVRFNAESINASDTNSILFIADASHLHQKYQSDMDEVLTSNIHELFVSITTYYSRIDTRQETALKQACFYFLCSMSIAKATLERNQWYLPVMKIQELLLHQHARNHAAKCHPLLQSAYSSLLITNSGEELSALVNHLVTISIESNETYFDGIKLSGAVHCFHIMVQVAKGQSQRHVLATHAHHFTSIAINLHCLPRVEKLLEWRNKVQVAESFLATLVGKKDLLLMNGTDISCILASINTILSIPTNQTQEQKLVVAPNTLNNIYIHCCGTILALMKHYPKLIYGCVPSFISSLRTLFKFILCQSFKSTLDSTEIIAEFDKICQLLPEHKDIFKKHIIGLVMDYVDALQGGGGMGNELKREITPCVYNMLDTLTTFEIQQLNTVMDPTSKVLFQSVFKSYQKRLYKGQF